MGRIFSFQEIESRQVPDEGDFELARNTFIEVASGCIDIDGSFVYGSVAIGAVNRRSDLDTFIALTEDNPRVYDVAKYVVRCVQEEISYRIPILPIVQPRSALETGHHDLDRFFGQHLSGSHRVVEGNDPAEYISFRNQPARDVLADYLFHKKRRLTNTYTSSSPLDVKEGGLQRMLELPPAIGRKALQAMGETGIIDKAVERSADKTEVLNKSRSIFETYGLEQGFDVLVRANKDYDELLDDALAGRVEKETYEDMIENLYSRLPNSIIWVEQLARVLLPLFKS